MKLKNKKTGEIVEVESLYLTQTQELYLNYINEENKQKVYTTDKIASFNLDWEDYEEPKVFWYINEFGTPTKADFVGRETLYDKCRKNFGNHFETEEDAKRAVEKLKAWKRLRDKGFRFEGWEDLQAEMGIDDLMLFNRDVINTDNVIGFRMDDYHDCIKDLNTCFGGEE